VDILETTAPSAHVARRSRSSSTLGWFGAGAALAVVFALMNDPSASPSPPGPVAVWTADRDASRVFGLDRDLVVARRIAVDYPLEVESASDGALWVLRNSGGQADLSQRLCRIDAHGEVETQLYLEPCRALGVLEGEQALVLERTDPATTVLTRVRREGSKFPLLSRNDQACVCGSRGTAIVGTDTGAVLRVDATSGVVLAEIQLGGSIGDVAAGPTPGSVWALDVQGTGRLFLLDERLAIRWAAGVGFSARHLGAVPGEERVWIADTSSPRVVRIGPSGVTEVDRGNLPLQGLDRVLAWTGGSALVLAPGALLHLDAQGQLAPGQGGFAWLSDAARVP
jgi:hypothetical protein